MGREAGVASTVWVGGGAVAQHPCCLSPDPAFRSVRVLHVLFCSEPHHSKGTEGIPLNSLLHWKPLRGVVALGSCFHTARELGGQLPAFLFHFSVSLPAFLSFLLQCLSFRPFSLGAIDWWADLTGDVAVRGFPQEVLTGQWGREEGHRWVALRVWSGCL